MAWPAALTAARGDQAYGFGWFLDPYKDHQRMWHTGSTMGFRTVIQRFVDDRLTIVILCNRADLDPRELSEEIADLILVHGADNRSPVMG